MVDKIVLVSRDNAGRDPDFPQVLPADLEAVIAQHFPGDRYEVSEETRDLDSELAELAIATLVPHVAHVEDLVDAIWPPHENPRHYTADQVGRATRAVTHLVRYLAYVAASGAAGAEEAQAALDDLPDQIRRARADAAGRYERTVAAANYRRESE
uniref:hypothetical protein n=1 Tax=Amycolatopsis sp. CA-096443 TaxID=3239919 RepID=UPI003F497751